MTGARGSAEKEGLKELAQLSKFSYFDSGAATAASIASTAAALQPQFVVPPAGGAGAGAGAGAVVFPKAYDAKILAERELERQAQQRPAAHADQARSGGGGCGAARSRHKG